MRDDLSGLEHEPKGIRHLIGPRLDHGFGWKLVERVVDFDGRKAFGVVAQHCLLRQFLWVEIPFPLLETVATGADEESHTSTTSTEYTNKKPFDIVVEGRHLLLNKCKYWTLGLF